MKQDLSSEFLSIQPYFTQIASLENTFREAHWEERYRRLLKIVGQAPKINPQWKQNNYLVKGCQSKAWLWFVAEGNGNYMIWCESESKIVQALVLLMLVRWDFVHLQSLSTEDLSSWLKSLGLERHLSSSRMGGLGSILRRIQEIPFGIC